MILKAFSSRHHTLLFDMDREFVEAVDEQEEFSFIAGFNLFDEENEKAVATVCGIFFDEAKILNEGEDIVELADMLDVDVYGAMDALSSSKIYNQEKSPDKEWMSLFSCYLQRVYVYPEYRNTGIARYIFENMEQVFTHCFNTPINSFVIFPKPQQPDVNDNWDNSVDTDGSMLKRMLQVIKKDGYKQIGKTGYYAKNCAAEK